MSFDTKGLKGLAISETGLIFNPTTGTIFTTNAVGMTILTALRDGKTTDAISAQLLEEYEVDPEVVEHDLFDFSSRLVTCGLIKNG
jgi:hypothetical protein